MGILDFASTHSEHANMTYCIRSRLLAKATELSLTQGVTLIHAPASNNVSCGGLVQSSIRSLLPPFYPDVISFTRPSSRLLFRVSMTGWLRLLHGGGAALVQ